MNKPSPFEIGFRLYMNGFGISHLVGAVEHDGQLEAAHRGYEAAKQEDIMNKKIKPEYFEFALQTGGSHYPGVGGELLSTFGDMIARECAKIARSNEDNTTARQIESRFGLEEEDDTQL
jgi:hypothetical protein